ncbi:hypothetical protein QCM80_24275 [Bradyrhizobium sp. SSUT112]|uniref:hypothetical protein n=1 Tax=unclassified Bradyrhizobium TaxID=2631580 RepID=UPI00244BC5AE|nr:MULTISPECIES: hypothetical protein [unclassified Bradyrhizobium]MDH2353750.1 hypothetical protein [Bradyrhizobium sp. SSUT112]
MGFVITPEFTTPASIAKNDIATTATADAIAILVQSDCGIEVLIGRTSLGA